MARSNRHHTTVLTVDTGPGHRPSARFYRLTVGRRGSGEVRAEVLVPEGDALRTTHRHENTDEVA